MRASRARHQERSRLGAGVEGNDRFDLAQMSFSSFRRASVWVNRLEEVLMGLLLAVMTLLTFTQVVLRYLFATGFVWSLEATTYCFAWLVLIGMAQGVRERSHIAVDLAVRKLAPDRRRLMALLAAGVCLLYAVLMLYGSVVFLDQLYLLGHDARDIPLPRWALTLILPLAFGLLLLRFMQITWAVYTGRQSSLGFGREDR